jgi:aryl-alcohol dehydrogenase-like predicted oxidoreductase/predicted kinase
MRLSTGQDHDYQRGRDTILTAAGAGITVFDTARVYGPGNTDAGHNEGLVAGALRDAGLGERARIVTKGGMTRARGSWVPDGRASAIRADCEASLAALGGLPIDLYLLHAPDPRTPWTTSVRALARLGDEGLVRRVGLSNINRTQLEQALDLAPVAAIQVSLSVFDDDAVRGGLLALCDDLDITVIAHSPLGGPRRHAGLARRVVLTDLAAGHGATAAEVALAWLLTLSPNVVVIPGARRPGAVISAVRAATLELASEEREALRDTFGWTAPSRPPASPAGAAGDVVILMGIPGAGKSRLAAEYVGRGYTRLNRDELGGTLAGVADALDEALAAGVRRVVLDNTYLTRAARSHVVEVAHRHGVLARCLWLDTPLAQAQVNLVERLIAVTGSLPPPDEVRRLARRRPGMMMPTSQMRTLRELEEPSSTEGFAAVERVPFGRGPRPRGWRAGAFVALGALAGPGWQEAVAAGDTTAPHLVFDWDPDGTDADLATAAERLATVVTGRVEVAACRHPGGPPSCWCRPPLPGLPLAFAHTHGIDLDRTTLVGVSSAHRSLAAALGSRFIVVTAAGSGPAAGLR